MKTTPPVHAYNRAEHGDFSFLDEKVSEFFTWREVFTSRPNAVISNTPCLVFENARKMALRLDRVRHQFKAPITVTSWYRDPDTNKRVGGKPNSFHLRGMAVDFTVAGATPKQVQDALEEVWQGGMGYGATFTHLDIRTFNARFSY